MIDPATVGKNGDSNTAGSAYASEPVKLKGRVGFGRDPSQEFRETVAQVRETIALVEGAVTARGCLDAEPPYWEFFEACARGDFSRVQALLPAIPNVSHQAGFATPLHLAACNGHDAVVKLLIESGAYLEARLGVIDKHQGLHLAGATPLLLAKANHRDSVIRQLLFHGANADATTDSGLSAEALLRALRQITPGLTSINLRLT